MTQQRMKPITVDIENLARACKAFRDAVREGLIHIGREYAALVRRERAKRLDAIRAAQEDGTFRRAEDIRQIRKVAERERRAARAHLDCIVQAAYDDLGMERQP